MISIEDFAKVELRVATIHLAERVTGSEKLIRLEVEAGDLDAEGKPMRRQVLAGIGKAYDPGELPGKRIVIVANLASRMMMGLESNGMILAATDPATGALSLLTPEREVAPGSTIR